MVKPGSRFLDVECFSGLKNWALKFQPFPVLACCIFCLVPSVDTHSVSMLVILCLNLEEAAGLGLVLYYHSLCWNYSVHFCFTDFFVLEIFSTISR